MTYGPQQPQFSAPDNQPSAVTPPPVVIDVGGDAKVKALIGGSVAGVIGLVSIFASFTGHTTGSRAADMELTFGLIFLFIGLLPILAWRKLSRPRKLVFDNFGVHWDGPTPWAAPWNELAGVSISRTRPRRVKPTDYLIRRTRVRLDLFPADPGFRTRHPGMEHLWELHTVKNGYRLPLGSNPKHIPVIEHAMRQYHPAIYLGIRDEGFMVGPV
ncbi:hypothetical protein ABZ912_60275 [Nonomuraea angiospora]|uniref:hypothetical protein n=1 Tax=Nonomuraea angiospora TaxID=46172 RepID=UPI0033DB494D